MLATIILDAFQKDECRSIADALDVICSPDDTYGFASACVYAFWSVPERELLYIGLARNISHRFQQHTRLITCEPNSCKSKEIETYFINHISSDTQSSSSHRCRSLRPQERKNDSRRNSGMPLFRSCDDSRWRGEHQVGRGILAGDP